MRKKIRRSAGGRFQRHFWAEARSPLSRLAALYFLFALSGLGCAPTSGTMGAILAKQSDGRLFIHDAPTTLGAHQAGLQPGDEVLLIEGRDVRPLSDAELHRLLEGPVGSSVRLTVLRGGEVLHVTVVRTKPPGRRASSKDGA